MTKVIGLHGIKEGGDNMTTIQIINYGAVELYSDDDYLYHRDVGSKEWNTIPLGGSEAFTLEDIVEEFLIPTLGCDESWLEIDDIPPKVETEGSFITDEAKMRDFLTISKDEFLRSYSYLDEDDYNATYDAVMNLIGKSLGWEYTIAEEFGCEGCPYNNGDGFTCTNHGEAGTLPCEQ